MEYVVGAALCVVAFLAGIFVEKKNSVKIQTALDELKSKLNR